MPSPPRLCHTPNARRCRIQQGSLDFPSLFVRSTSSDVLHSWSPEACDAFDSQYQKLCCTAFAEIRNQRNTHLFAGLIE